MNTEHTRVGEEEFERLCGHINIEITQIGGRFTMQLVEDGKTHVLASDNDGPVVGYQWWLNPAAFNLPEELKKWGCSDAQIRQVFESLASGGNTHLVLDIPQRCP